KHEHWGLKNLMLFIVACTGMVLLLSGFMPELPYYLAFDRQAIMNGELWRLITFIFIPPPTAILLLTVIVLYFYYYIGSTLEREWGRLKFTIFYLTGMIGTALYAMLTGSLADATFLNLSMFFAMATLFPEMRVLLFFIIPVKIKWMAIASAVLFIGWPILEALISGRFTLFYLSPLIALANYLLYFHAHFISLIRRDTRHHGNVVKFRQEVRRAKQSTAHTGHTHKCRICGVTDADSPNTEFRYCSMCARYECYCAQHIFTHEHTK
ncbi:MAG: rhomboid family intramembrane serine protease, partial [Oscillospiraceae bacterium]|nr:rhomboid family intramembrane serine protease [Oscillospiraceae bacterium]